MLMILMLSGLVTTIPQDPHQGMNDRGAMVMGFDQDKAAHHFYLYADGGAIAISVMDPSDVKDRDAIRSHLPHIVMMFSNGDFDAPMLVHDTKDVPGIDILAREKDKVAYRYKETSLGGRVDITTTDPETLAALHRFLEYQIREHHTGDTPRVSGRR
jgi:hypothetical protein